MSLYEDLSKPFSESAERQLRKGGTSLTYIPQAEVVNRLNKVFGVQGWSMQILYVGRDQTHPDWVVAHVRLVATVFNDEGGSYTFSRDGVGGQAVKHLKDGSGPVDLGDEFKGAVSDALKKAASLFGIGLYLARDEDAMDEEAEADQPVREPHAQWQQFADIVKTLNDKGKADLNKFWEKRTKGGPKPTSTTVTDEDMEALLVEVQRLALSGEYVKSA